MKELLTPKQVARALAVSESSVKRWCDRGIISTQYTAGGHRRIPLAGLVRYLRSTGHELVAPEVIGLPVASGRTQWVLDRAAEEFAQALLAGDLARSRQIMLDLYLAEHSVSTICDDVVAAALAEIGDRWACGHAEIYEERRGCDITLYLLHDLASLLPPAAPGAPLAIGAAPGGDHYNIGTTMAALVLRDAGWHATSLGNHLPWETLAAAIRAQRPRLFWLSCSHVADEPAFLRGYGDLYDEFGMEVAIVVGGRALDESLRSQMKYAAYCDKMRHLEAFAQALHRSEGPAAAATTGSAASGAVVRSVT